MDPHLVRESMPLRDSANGSHPELRRRRRKKKKKPLCFHETIVDLRHPLTAYARVAQEGFLFLNAPAHAGVTREWDRYQLIFLYHMLLREGNSHPWLVPQDYGQ